MMNTEEYVDTLVARARTAQQKFEETFLTQEDVDRTVRAIGKTIYDNRATLAKLAADETKMGNATQKESKIIATTTTQWNIMRGHKSMGYIENIRKEPGVRVLAKPIGVIGCICPSTNPVITIAANAMMSIKCRNAAIIAGHPAAKETTMQTVNLVRAAFKEIGAPEDLLQAIDPEHASIATTDALLRKCDTNIATGGPGMVKSVYSCGKPGFGVGQGNDQEIYGDDWTDWEKMAELAINNRAYDNGVPCTGEQMLHIPESKEKEFLDAWTKKGAYLIDDDKTRDKLRELIFPDGKHINREVVGKSPSYIGRLIGLDIPESTITLLTKVTGKGTEDVLCKEILFPFMRYRTYTDFKDAVNAAVTNLKMEGAGHNSAVLTYDQEKIDYVAHALPVCRLNINQTTFGINNGVPTTSTLGCGFWSGNSISENFEWYHLYQTTRTTTTLPNKRLWHEGDWDDLSICPVVEE